MKERFEVKSGLLPTEKWTDEDLVSSLVTNLFFSVIQAKTDFDERSLPKTIQLGPIFARAREIAADDTKRKFVHGEEIRKEGEELKRRWEQMASDLDEETFKAIFEPRLGWIFQASEVERTSILGYHPQRNEIQWLEPVYGEVGRSVPPRGEVLLREMYPLIEFHTHDTQSFFSPRDFFSLAVSFQEILPDMRGQYENPFPFCPVALLAAKNNWLLALRTDLSPLLSFQEWDELIAQDEEERKDLLSPLEAQLDGLKKEEERLRLSSANLILKRLEGYRRKLEELKKEGKEVDLSEFIAACLGEKEELDRKFWQSLRALKQAQAEIDEEIERLDDQKSLEFAFSLKLALYHSPDGINFQRFSA